MSTRAHDPWGPNVREWTFVRETRELLNSQRPGVLWTLEGGTDEDGRRLSRVLNLLQALEEATAACDVLLQHISRDSLSEIGRATYNRARSTLDALSALRALVDSVEET